MNLTITVDPKVLKRARVRAIEEDTSVSAVLRDQLATYADGGGSLERAAEQAAQRRSEAIESLIRLSLTRREAATDHPSTRDEHGNRTWKRDDLYDR